MDPQPPQYVKVTFRLNPDDWHRTPSERLWATPVVVPGESNAFELENTPFFARGVSYKDIIRATYEGEDYVYSGPIASGGHSTFRIVFEEEDEVTKQWWSRLQILGCSREWGVCEGWVLYAVDVPPATALDTVVSILQAGSAQGVWKFEEGHMGHRLSS